MKTPLFSTTRFLQGTLVALVILPALPMHAEGPIDHLKKRRQQIHQKVGEFFSSLGRKLEDAVDPVEHHRGYGPVPPPPPPSRYERDPYLDEDEQLEFELRMQQGPRRTFPDGTPYPDSRQYREDRRVYPDEFRGSAGREPSLNPYSRRNGRDSYNYPEPGDDVEPGLRAPERRVTPQTVPQPRPDPAPMVEKKRSNASDLKPAPIDPKSSADSTLRYGRPVPGKQGFVYPPGVKEESKNMIDVRDFRPGQKVKDPRTGEIFLVP